MFVFGNFLNIDNVTDNKISANRTLENHLEKREEKKLAPNALIQSITKLFNAWGIKPIRCHLSCLEWKSDGDKTSIDFMYHNHFSLYELGTQEKLFWTLCFTLYFLWRVTLIFDEKNSFETAFSFALEISDTGMFCSLCRSRLYPVKVNLKHLSFTT